MKSLIRNLPIRIKFAFPILLVMSLLLISVYIYFPQQHKKALLKSYTETAIKTAQVFSAAVSFALVQHNFRLLEKSISNLRIENNIQFLILYDENNEQLAVYNPGNLDLPQISSVPDNHISENGHLLVRDMIYSQDGEYLGKVILSYRLDEMYGQLDRDRYATIVFTFSSMLVSFILISFISRRVTSSLRRLRNQMYRAIDEGEYSSNLHITSRDEIGQLATSFNVMMSEIRLRHSRLVNTKKRYQMLNKRLSVMNNMITTFLSNASHSLRTPLTIILGEVELALSKERSVKEYESALKVVEEETRFLSHIVSDLLTLARADSGSLITFRQELSFSELVRTELKHIERLAKKKRIKVVCKIVNECVIVGDPDRLGEMIRNIMENAVKYTYPDKSIYIDLKANDQYMQFSVCDEGIGIDEKELENIFNRFYRTKRSREISGGTGLGLAIAKSIAEAHDGVISVSSEIEKGSCFIIKLPFPEKVLIKD